MMKYISLFFFFPRSFLTVLLHENFDLFPQMGFRFSGDLRLKQRKNKSVQGLKKSKKKSKIHK